MKPLYIKLGVFFGMILVTAGIIGGIHLSADEEKEKEPVDTRPVISVETLVLVDHQVQITSFGEVVPLENTILAAQVSGEVLNWHPNFVAGGVVKRGDILFTIEPDTYEAAVLQAEAQISLAQAALIEEQAHQKVAERESRNVPQNQISDLYLRKPQVLSAKAQLKSAEASLRIANRNLAKTKVTAPYDALIVSRDIGTGQFVSAGMSVARINNIETAEVIVPIAGFDSVFLPESLEQTVATVSTPGQNLTTRQGKINRNIGLVDQDTRMQHVVVRIEDPYGIKSDVENIKFGAYVEVSFAGKTLQNVYKVPQSLVTNRTVWVLNDDNQLQSRKVEVVREEGTYFYINNGLERNQRLVKNLPEYPQNGMLVRVKESSEVELSTATTAVPSGN